MKALASFLFAAACLAVLAGCKTVPERVQELSSNSYFQEASTVISSEQAKLSKRSLT